MTTSVAPLGQLCLLEICGSVSDLLLPRWEAHGPEAQIVVRVLSCLLFKVDSTGVCSSLF